MMASPPVAEFDDKVSEEGSVVPVPFVAARMLAPVAPRLMLVTPAPELSPHLSDGGVVPFDTIAIKYLPAAAL